MPDVLYAYGIKYAYGTEHLHTFCKECLETRMEVARNHTRCPLCHVVLPQHLGFPNDFRIKRL